MPKLSVIMPVYNTEKFLKRSIESILNQTFTDFELILINDGSKDGSLTILKEYEKQDKRVKVIDKNNEGAGPARNVGIDVATGEYLAFPDSDDWLDLDAYENCIKKIEEVNADLLIFGMKTYIYDDKTGTQIDVINNKAIDVYYNSTEKCRANWVKLHMCCDMDSPCNKIYRKSLIDNNLIKFPDLRRMQDGVFNTLFFRKVSSIRVIENCYFNRTWHSVDFQNKKMPRDLIHCAIVYRETAIESLKEFDQDNSDNINYFDMMLREIVYTILFSYKPEKSDFKSTYKYVRKTIREPIINEVFRNNMRNKTNIRKFDYLIVNRLSFIITLYLKIKIYKKR